MPAVRSSGARRPPDCWMASIACRIPFDAIADGVRKIAVEQQELHQAAGGEIGGVYLAVGLERGTAAQQPDHFEIHMALTLPTCLLKKILLIDLEQCRGSISALQIAAKADKLPALAVDHSGVRSAFEKIDAIDNRGQRVAGTGAELRLRVRRMDLMEEPVQALPLLGGDLFAHLARVFPRRIHAILH